MTPRVGLSLLTLVPGVVGGSETYCRELCRALGRAGRHEYRAFVPTIAPDAAGPLPYVVVPEYRASRTIPGRLAAMALAGVAGGAIRRRVRAEAPDALHFPLSVMLPEFRAPPAATTIHDLQHELHPAFFSRGELAYRRLVYGRTVRASRIVIAISEHARATLIERYGLAPDRVRTIHLGIDHDRFRPGQERRERFLLYPANGWPHKNHAALFAAFRLLRREEPELRLVLTGAAHDRLTLPAGAESLGHVDFDRLRTLYRTAGALVFPSLYEGFGLPPLEAMACGCPVAASTATSLPEVVGDAAELFDPRDPEAIATAVRRVLDAPSAYVERGLARAAGFTWDACARAHDDVYADLATG